MPQAIERLLAMPVTRAFFPVRSSIEIYFHQQLGSASRILKDGVKRIARDGVAGDDCDRVTLIQMLYLIRWLWLQRSDQRDVKAIEPTWAILLSQFVGLRLVLSCQRFFAHP